MEQEIKNAYSLQHKAIEQRRGGTGRSSTDEFETRAEHDTVYFTPHKKELRNHIKDRTFFIPILIITIIMSIHRSI